MFGFPSFLQPTGGDKLSKLPGVKKKPFTDDYELKEVSLEGFIRII